MSARIRGSTPVSKMWPRTSTTSVKLVAGPCCRSCVAAMSKTVPSGRVGCTGGPARCSRREGRLRLGQGAPLGRGDRVEDPEGEFHTGHGQRVVRALLAAQVG